jgi:hypothetical protein
MKTAANIRRARLGPLQSMDKWLEVRDNESRLAPVKRCGNMNSIQVIAPYKYEGLWVFDDPATGLVREPFVAGIDTMMEMLVANIPNADKGFRLLFSAIPFPGHTVKLEWRREEAGGNWYYSPQFGMEGWLCPALFKYFDQAPRELYGRAEPKPTIS